jgi:Holliday junction resolvase
MDGSSRGRYSRNKGARAERELCNLLSEYLGIEVTRQYKQYAQAQHGDVEQLIGPYLLEIKNQARISLGAWWDQARAAAAARGGCLPCVAYRLPNRGLYDRWRFVVPDALRPEHDWQLDYGYTADLGLEAFAARVRERL